MGYGNSKSDIIKINNHSCLPEHELFNLESKLSSLNEEYIKMQEEHICKMLEDKEYRESYEGQLGDIYDIVDYLKDSDYLIQNEKSVYLVKIKDKYFSFRYEYCCGIKTFITNSIEEVEPKLEMIWEKREKWMW